MPGVQDNAYSIQVCTAKLLQTGSASQQQCGWTLGNAAAHCVESPCTSFQGYIARMFLTIYDVPY